MPQAHARTIRPGLLALLMALEAAQVSAQRATGFEPIEKPGIHGVRIHPGALAPNRRKWFLPQNLFYEYNWRHWEYSNYARDTYQRYVNVLLEGTRFYDGFGNYIGRGWRIYDWTEANPRRNGSGILKGPKFGQWFSNVVISSAHHGQFHSSLLVGQEIRTTLTPLTFSKPTFNGLQWDFLSDKYALTVLASRLNVPGVAQDNEGAAAQSINNSTRLLATRGVAQVGDFAKVGATWVNSHQTNSELDLGDLSLQGVLTDPQNLGTVDNVVIRIRDDSPDTPDEGALLYVDQVLLNGVVHPEIVATVVGGVRRGSVLEVTGADEILLIYDIRNGFRPTDELPTLAELRKLEFELVVANDYAIEVASNRQLSGNEEVFLPVAQAREEITDGSNQRFIRFAYGLPTANQVVGVDVEIFQLGGLNVRGEYVVNHRYRRLPNQAFRKLPAASETAGASYVTASYTAYPWFAYGEGYSLDPDYSTTSYMADGAGRIDYANDELYKFEFVDDNDDQDRFADWRRNHQTVAATSASGSLSFFDQEVFPGLDENNDFISDFNQNQNGRPDYAEPFLRYRVDPPEFLFGMDMNNNGIIDRFEDDRRPDYPYEAGYRGYNAYGGLSLTQDLQVTGGRLSERQMSSGRRSRSVYGLLTARWDRPRWKVSVFEHVKSVRDDIPEHRLRWVDPVGIVDVQDQLENRDTFVNTTYAEGEYAPIEGLNVAGKVKWEIFEQRGDEADDPGRRNRRFLGLVSRVDYTLPITESLSLQPRWKSLFRRETPTSGTEVKRRELTQILFFTGRYGLLPTMWLDFGVERRYFSNLIERPDEPPPGYQEDAGSWVFSILLGNVSDYLGYRLTMNSGLQLERNSVDTPVRGEDGEVRVERQSTTSAVFLIRFFAAISRL